MGRLSANRAHEALADFVDLPIQRWPSAAALRLRAFGLRENLLAYDAAYHCLGWPAQIRSSDLIARLSSMAA
ncbi:hypothetical protein SAMN02745244_00631 [Tessaracoccus bendigoensis DSM 12906]|uniref:Uncharacterized protein n=1 Tax=Tessaracoccus bendigoensis DSM 12906 TaxID=1123357 RepID=A0A1M6C9P7_9ACTN|nr:hypothetical protein SAMN02745244_00631 [Tessaracoccus bendigoensis DSM 12906]